MTLSFALHHAFPTSVMDMAFEVPSPGVTVLFGPSGAGKSTMINAAAGLLRPDRCRIVADGQVLADTDAGVWLPPEKRHVGLVFQDSRLFPHMSVATNLRFGLRRSGGGPIRFDTVIELLGIGGLLARRPHTLSGGERQRVAIGRALLAQPRLLLMDEPLASLDAARKVEIMPFLTRLKTSLNLPILYVTHSLEEVAYLADSLVLIEAGRVTAHGPAPSVAARADLLLGQRDDAAGIVPCVVDSHDHQRLLTLLRGGGGSFWVPLMSAAVGTSCRIRVPAREVILASTAPQGISLHNVIACTVRRTASAASGQTAMVELALPDGALLSRVTTDAISRLALVPGAPVLALIKSTSIEILASDSGAEGLQAPSLNKMIPSCPFCLAVRGDSTDAGSRDDTGPARRGQPL